MLPRGAGIAGLTLAIALGRCEDPVSPIEIDMYESGTEITTVGAGISVWPRTWAIMRRLGLYDELMQEAVKSKGETKKDQDEGSEHQAGPAFVFRKSDWPREGFEFGRVMVPDGATTMHRADMVRVLVRHLPARCTIHTSKRLVSYDPPPPSSPNDTHTLHFADGTHATADVVIGADGIKSAVRSSMYAHTHVQECESGDDTPVAACARCARSRPKWTGTVAYRYLIPTERLRAVNPAHHALHVAAPMSLADFARQHIITYLISHGKYLNWIGFVTRPGQEGTEYPHKWVLDANRDDVVREFAGWEPEVDQMIACVEDPTLWAIHVIDDLPFSVSGRVALMGDAVHAMTTHFGAGGGQAIEDAYLLGTLLTDPRTSPPRLPRVLEIYQAVRLPFARAVVRNARAVGLMYEFNSPGLYAADPARGEPTAVGVRSEEVTAAAADGDGDGLKRRLGELERAIRGMWQWQWKEKVEEQWAEAERMMDELGSRTAPRRRRQAERWCVVA
ncbi:uncharacterized protein BXZ73DRAFT_57355 [Epithele typhae]|uniref:uncharacterized protein n=1 Tax=Epithele typhae TaxID=378194 RepID=UPI0020076A35|nr:uncharacterized protein BXZ73DRAFT_57355 [Epithele typhae]KAH9911102.1 hypothetical protein BXZ73DRAFT_57355 [Epithele typhae]